MSDKYWGWEVVEGDELTKALIQQSLYQGYFSVV